MAVATEPQNLAAQIPESILKEDPHPQPDYQIRAANASPTSGNKGDPIRRQRHEQLYMPEGNIVIQVCHFVT